MFFAIARTSAKRSPKSIIMIVAAALTAMLFSVLAGAPSASAAPLPDTALVAQVATPAAAPSLVLPMATTTPLSTHCGVTKRWKKIFGGKDSKVRVRVWRYTTSTKHTRYYCTLVNRLVKTTKVMGINVVTYTSVSYNVTTKGAKVWAKLKVPRNSVATARVFYNGVWHSDRMIFWGYTG